MKKDHVGFPMSIATCSCGKMSYMSRSDAKKAARAMLPSVHASAYQCDISGYYHFGRLAPEITRGTGTRDGSRAYPPSATQWAARKSDVFGPEARRQW